MGRPQEPVPEEIGVLLLVSLVSSMATTTIKVISQGHVLLSFSLSVYIPDRKERLTPSQ
jgi:hypothetical protein